MTLTATLGNRLEKVQLKRQTFSMQCYKSIHTCNTHIHICHTFLLWCLRMSLTSSASSLTFEDREVIISLNSEMAGSHGYSIWKYSITIVVTVYLCPSHLMWLKWWRTKWKLVHMWRIGGPGECCAAGRWIKGRIIWTTPWISVRMWRRRRSRGIYFMAKNLPSYSFFFSLFACLLQLFCGSNNFLSLLQNKSALGT